MFTQQSSSITPITSLVSPDNPKSDYSSADSQLSLNQAMNVSEIIDDKEDKEDNALEIVVATKDDENKSTLVNKPNIMLHDSSSISNDEEKGSAIDTFYTKRAHILRRTYHVVSFTLLPIIYLWTARPISDALNVNFSKILAFIIFIQIILEYIRIKKRFIIFGQREYERYHICAQAWGTIASCIVFLLAFPRTYSISPVNMYDENKHEYGSEAYACFGQIIIPIIWTLGFGDPLLGELKRYVRENKISVISMYIIADVCISLVWILCFLWLGTPFWMAIIIPPIAIIAENPSIKDIDDNGLMLLIPLLFSLLLEPWFPKKCTSVFY